MPDTIKLENETLNASGLALGTRLFEKWCDLDKEIKLKTGQPPEIRFQKWVLEVARTHGKFHPDMMALIAAIVLHNEL